MREKIVIALGGNALQSGKEAATAEAQLKTVKETAERIAEICERGSEIAVVHGNGPQVGRILLASETAKDVTPPMPSMYAAPCHRDISVIICSNVSNTP